MYAAVDTAKDWGKTPTEFFALDEDDKAMMIAYSRDTARMRAWEAHEQEKAMKKPKRSR